MAEWMARDLAIEDALKTELKEIQENNNQSYVDLCALSDKGKKNKVKLTYDGLRSEERRT